MTCEGVTNPTCTDCPVTQTQLSCPSSPFSGTLTHNYGGSDYTGGLAPGDYVYTFKVSTGGSASAHNPTFDITFTLTDPCDPPISLDRPTFESQDYVISTTLTYQHPEFTIDPDFCNIAYSYELFEAVQDGSG